KAVLNYVLVDSAKGNGDHKYLFGTAKTDSWIGVLGAEKSDLKPAEKPNKE
ncbi:PlpP, partial [Pasteurella multocida subsp. multocida str. P52VAC]